MQEDTERTTTGYLDEPATSRGVEQRFTVHEAASLLGLSVDAVRKRAERGSLRKEKSSDGTVYIVLDNIQSLAGYPTSRRAAYDETMSGRDLLVSSLKDQLSCLRSELETRNEELRRKDHLLAAALERVPQVEETSDNSGPWASCSDTTKKGDDIPHEPATRCRSWVVRFFFGP